MRYFTEYKIRTYLLITALALIEAVPAYSSTEGDLNKVVDGIQAKYEEIDSFHATFTQEATVKALDKVQTAEGEVWFKKPGMMRWNYYRPSKDEIVSDGQTMWYYTEQENQVIETPIRGVSDDQTTTTLLSGLGEINKLFNASFSEAENPDSKTNYLIDLTPKNTDEEYNKVTVAVNKDTMLVNTMYLYDPFGNLTTVKLKDIEIDKDVPGSLFKFAVPAGVEVIRPPAAVSQ